MTIDAMNIDTMVVIPRRITNVTTITSPLDLDILVNSGHRHKGLCPETGTYPLLE